ncbi:hypothetical protein QEN19_004081 [Hanseniaspora menglaensis]
MVPELNSIFDQTNSYRSEIYPFLFTNKLITNKRFQLLFNKGNVLTNIQGTNVLLPIIDIYTERFNESNQKNAVLCCLGTHLFHSFVIIVESLRIDEQEIIEGIKFIISTENKDYLEAWKYLLAFFLIYLKLVYKNDDKMFLKIINNLENDSECMSLVEYGQLQLKTVPFAFDIVRNAEISLEDPQIVTLMDLIAVETLWSI